MPRLISEQSFYRFVKCPNWVYFDAHQTSVQPVDPLRETLLDEGLLEEQKRALIRDRRDVADVAGEDPEEAFKETLRYMREGRETIYHGVLVDGHWVGHPDILEKVEGRSRFGNWYYVAADIKRTRGLREDHQFQGCFYAELLEKIQGTKPQQGYIIDPDAKVHSYSIAGFEATYHLALVDIEAIVAGKKPAHFLTSGCKQSPWFHACTQNAEAADNITLLNRIWGEEVLRLERAGVTTIAQLARTSVSSLERLVPDIHPTRLMQLRDQAVALAEHRHIVRSSPELPEPARCELFFDIESNPLRDFDYLFGVLVVEDGKEQYHAFMADYPTEEEKNWHAFTDLLQRFIDAPMYHFGWFEVEVVRRFIAKYGCPPLVQDAFERNLVDLFPIVRQSITFPLSFYSLKDIASYLGFHWRAEDAGGANSVLWVEEWIRHKNPAVKEKILAYNEDDCRATHVLKTWLTSQNV